KQNHQNYSSTSVKKGFDFVGFHFRVYPDKTGPKGAKSLVKPTREGKRRLLTKIKNAVMLHRSATAVLVK
ncbi:unnamed protein product, partial [Laminaria digitata]